MRNLAPCLLLSALVLAGGPARAAPQQSGSPATTPKSVKTTKPTTAPVSQPDGLKCCHMDPKSKVSK